jgi:hypothetical protein
MSIKNIKIGNCSSSDIKVCFGQDSSCDVIVTPLCLENCHYDYGGYEYGKIKKGTKSVEYYSSALLYAGIFSSPDIYECNVKRLMQRASAQCSLLSEKSFFANEKCGFVSRENLLPLSSSALRTLIFKVKELDELNLAASCQLW